LAPVISTTGYYALSLPTHAAQDGKQRPAVGFQP
jgi:hypothetical protein